MTRSHDIIMSIKPEYATQIFDGTKRYEFRRVCPKDNINRMYIHVCGENPSEIQGIATVEEVISGTPAEIWNICKDYAGVPIDKFYQYFEGRRCACAYKIADAKRLNTPISIQELNMRHIPQSFSYIRSENPKNMEVTSSSAARTFDPFRDPADDVPLARAAQVGSGRDFFETCAKAGLIDL